MTLFNRAALLAAACSLAVPVAAQTVKKPTVASVNADLQAAKADLQAQINALKQPAPAPSPTPAPTPTPSATGAWQRCAIEGASCALPRSPVTVRYGVDGTWVTKSVQGTSVSCTNAVFGDPAVGRGKTCEVEATATTVPPAPATSDGKLRIGMNLDGDAKAYWGTNYAFLDRMRAAGNWNGVDGEWANRGEAPLKIDATTGELRGWSPDIVYATTLAPMESASEPVTRRYRITWDGKGSVETGYKTFVNTVSTSNSLTFDYVGDGPSTQIIVRMTDQNDPVRNIRFVRADQAALLDAGQLFTPEFLAKASQWTALRFMDWGSTNGSQVTTPADMIDERRTSWPVVPLSAQVRLANEAKTDMWYCIPAHANDALVRATLVYVRDHLAPGLKLHLEYSNEIWNWGFEQTHYARDQGTALGKQLGVTDVGAVEWYGYRSAQIAKISGEVFGADAARVLNVLGTQTYWLGLEDGVLKGVALAKLGTPAQLFDEYAITTYFGHSFGGGTDADKAKVLGWARAGDAGVAAAITELTTGGTLSDNSSVANLAKVLAYHAGVSRRVGLDLVAYEGGPHLTALGFPDNTPEQADVTAFIDRIVKAPAFKAVTAASIEAFRANGGKLLVAFNDIGRTSRYGAWGVLESPYQTTSPRYDAYLAAQRSAGK